MKIIKHSFCKLTQCPLINKDAVVTDTIPAVVDKNTGQITEPEWYWARVDGMQHKFQKGDLE